MQRMEIATHLISIRILRVRDEMRERTGASDGRCCVRRCHLGFTMQDPSGGREAHERTNGERWTTSVTVL